MTAEKKPHPVLIPDVADICTQALRDACDAVAKCMAGTIPGLDLFTLVKDTDTLAIMRDMVDEAVFDAVSQRLRWLREPSPRDGNMSDLACSLTMMLDRRGAPLPDWLIRAFIWDKVELAGFDPMGLTTKKEEEVGLGVVKLMLTFHDKLKVRRSA